MQCATNDRPGSPAAAVASASERTKRKQTDEIAFNYHCQLVMASKSFLNGLDCRQRRSMLDAMVANDALAGVLALEVGIILFMSRANNCAHADWFRFGLFCYRAHKLRFRIFKMCTAQAANAAFRWKISVSRALASQADCLACLRAEPLVDNAFLTDAAPIDH